MKINLATVAAIAAIGLTGAANAAVSDLFEDAQDTFGVGGELLDVAQWDITYDAENLYFTVDFFTPISPPGLELPNSMTGLLELDTDQDSGTGNAPIQNGFPGFAVLDSGWDFVIDLSGLLFDSTFALVATFDVVYTDTSVSGMFALDLIGGDDGIVDYTGTIGTLAQPTDAMDMVGTSTIVPAPGAFALLGLSALAGRTRRRDA